MTVGNRVRLLRERKGLTREQLAVYAGCSATTLTRLERDERVPKVEILDRLARELDTNTADLLREAS